MKKTVLKEAIKSVLRRRLNEIAYGKNSASPSSQQYGSLTGKENNGDPEALIHGYGKMPLSLLKKETIGAFESIKTELNKEHYENVEHLLEPHSITILFVKALRQVSSQLPLKESVQSVPGQTYTVDRAVAAIVLHAENDLISVVSCDSSQEEINRAVWNLVCEKAKELGLVGPALEQAVAESMKRLGYASDSPNMREDATGESAAAVGDAITNALSTQSQTNPTDQKRITDLEKQKGQLQKDLEVDKARLAAVTMPLKKKIDQKTLRLGKLTTDIERAQNVASR